MKGLHMTAGRAIKDILIVIVLTKVGLGTPLVQVCLEKELYCWSNELCLYLLLHALILKMKFEDVAIFNAVQMLPTTEIPLNLCMCMDVYIHIQVYTLHCDKRKFVFIALFCFFFF